MVPCAGLGLFTHWGIHSVAALNPSWSMIKKCWCNYPDGIGYSTLFPYAFYFHGEGTSLGLKPKHGGCRTIAGRFGAGESKLGKTLPSQPHQKYKENGYYSDNGLISKFIWLEGNSSELGACTGAEKQKGGKVILPIGVDPGNPGSC